MDFRTAPEIEEAIRKRTAHGIYGYTMIPDEWYSAYIGWWKRRHHLEIRKEWLSFSTGVIPAIASIMRTLTVPGDQVLLQPPVYNHFFTSIRNNGRRVRKMSWFCGAAGTSWILRIWKGSCPITPRR